MFTYPIGYTEAKKELNLILLSLKNDGFRIVQNQFKVDNKLFINKIIINKSKKPKNRIIISAGLHGIEGFVGHCSIITFLNEIITQLTNDAEVVIYHVINPYGMENLSRNNEHNVDLNRNFSLNNFTSVNKGYEMIKDHFIPKEMKSKVLSNVKYYGGLTSLIKKYGVATLNDSILRGQNISNRGLYYTGTFYEPSTKYMISEIKNLVSGVKTCIWIDLHTGYGPRYQMSIINSKYEVASTLKLKENLEYPLILGTEEEDIYNTDGDMIEYIYSTHKSIKAKSDLLSLCFEFGTLGESVKQNVESLKALVFENNIRFRESTPKIIEYTKSLMKEQFLPSEEKWRIKAYEDFVKSTIEILNYKKLIK